MNKEVVYKNHGFDESNNGKFPVVYTLVSSNNPYDINKQKRELPKIRKNHSSLKNKLRSRDYSFLLLTNFESAFITNYKIIGVVLASLIYEKPIEDNLNLYIDGEWGIKTKDFAKYILRDITGLEKDLIEIHTGKDLDKKINLVNIADETAHWLLQKSFDSLRKNPHRKEIHKEFREFF